MDTRKKFIIEGSRIHDKESFYDEINRVFCPDFKGMGHNLDALVDVLRGGFGTFEYDEKIIVEFNDYKNAQKNLGEAYFSKIIEVFHEEEDLELRPKIEVKSNYR